MAFFDSFLLRLGLEPELFFFAVLVVFAAGVVRGFSGFAFSALVMAMLAVRIPPVELIVVCYFLEITASLTMMKSGWKDGNVKLALKLALGGVLGVPIGLTFTHAVAPDVSRLAALAVIGTLALALLGKVKARFLANEIGTYASGAVAGIATGLASVGGLVVALYVLARDDAAKVTRGSLVAYLFIGSCFSGLYFAWFGMFNEVNILRGLFFSVPGVIGVMVGKKFFNPKFEPYYRPFCLMLLIGIAGFGVLRLLANWAV